ncbi:MAG TPA: tyrosine protein phosphatase [Clostridiaceae bacterium]|nr:tyrosine protein phosphatase [Clostridiaceae bacterium]
MRKRKEIIAINSITDMHCHILPGMDDGAKDVETSVKMAQMALAEGISRIIATPHFEPDIKNIEDFVAKREEAILHLTSELKARGIDIEILTGAEVYLTPSLLELARLERLCLGNSRYMLVEIPFMSVPIWMDELLYSLQLKGVTPVLAHPERNIKLITKPQILDNFVDRGLMLQINASSFYDGIARDIRGFMKYVMKNQMVHFLATDAHSTGSRPPKIQDSIRVIADAYGRDIVEYMLENAREIR